MRADSDWEVPSRLAESAGAKSAADRSIVGKAIVAIAAIAVLAAAWYFYSAPPNLPTYPGCDTPDIVLPNGQRWAACNVGATTAYAGQEYPGERPPTDEEKSFLGAYFQWGRNRDVTTLPAGSGWVASDAGAYFYTDTEKTGYDWISSQNDDLWGGSGGTGFKGTYASLGAPAAMRGPCAEGYHVPTSPEWYAAISSLNPAIKNTIWPPQGDAKLRAALRLPLAGERHHSTGEYFLQGSRGVYWTASTYSIYGYGVAFSDTELIPINLSYRAAGMSVRCLANPSTPIGSEKEIPTVTASREVATRQVPPLARTNARPASGSGKRTTYPGCDTPDIVLPNGQRWAACNVGASLAWTGGTNIRNCEDGASDCDSAIRNTLGSYFQWGRNTDVTGLPPMPGWAPSEGAQYFHTGSDDNWYDWSDPPNDDLWWGSGSTTSTGTYASLGSPAAMRGPCAEGYHVPTQREWFEAASNLNPALANTIVHQDDMALATTLKLPLAGSRDWSSAYWGQGEDGYYWTSSPSGIYGHFVLISLTQVIPAFTSVRTNGMSIRCLRN